VIDEGDVGECVDPSQPSLTDAIDAWLAQRPEGITRYVRDDDREGVARLERAGYRPAPEEEMVGFSLDLDGLGPIEPDPRVSAVTRDDDLRPRLSVTHAGFGVDRPFEPYVKGYEAFMDSPAYPSGWDLVAWNRDGRAAACCIAWPDPVSHVGNFEPVATHPEFHRQGFGTTVMRDGLRRLRDAGMTRAIVRTVRSNQAAIALYRSLGFADDHVQRAFRRA
jgi:ribosomal protein S18 acetylase RimI-like enzyme